MKKIIAAVMALCLLFGSALATSAGGSGIVSGGSGSDGSIFIPDGATGGSGDSLINSGGISGGEDSGGAIAGPSAGGAYITQGSASQSAHTTVSHTVEEGYTVVIPSSLSFAEGQTTASAEIVIQKGGRIPAGKTLSVTLTGSANDFRLVNAADSSVALAYAVNGMASNAELSAKGPVASISAMDLAAAAQDARSTLFFEITGEMNAAGSFSDTLTFTVTIAD